MITMRYEAERCRTVALDGDQEIGYACYSPEGEQWVMDHTEVLPAYGGRGIAGDLVDLLVDQARTAGKKIVPACSYVAARFERTPEEYEDVWQRD